MKKFLLASLVLILGFTFAKADIVDIKLTKPKVNDTYRVGRSVAVAWDTLDTQGNRTFRTVFEFKWAESADGPWSLLALPKNAKSFKDSTGTKAIGTVNITLPRKNQVWLKIQVKGNETVNTVVGPINVTIPPAVTADSTITGDITGSLTLSSTKLYQLKGLVFVQDGGIIRIDPGTVIFGDNEATSALVINRGGKIYAKGTKTHPIIFTSGFATGSRDRGDWGGVLIMGTATTNLTEAAIEGGIADGSDVKKNGWYGKYNGVNNDEDSSGVMQYVRIEFAGIAESPDNELNGLTMGAVGSKTVIDHIQVSYGGDDSYEWFGGDVNGKYLIAFNGIDDDFDTDNGFSGKVQFGFSYRLPSIADQSNSEAFESDNDSKASENQPFTRPIFSNMTCIGGVRDTSWTSGSGDNKYNAKYLTAAQIRRNSRMSLVNSLLIGWPAGVEMTNDNTVRAAGNDSIMVKNNSFYGIKNEAKFFYFGSGTNPTDKITTSWLTTTGFDNNFVNGAGDVTALAKLTDAFPSDISKINPVPMNNAEYLTNASFADSRLQDTYFDKVNYRGAFSPVITERWDLPWSEYDPVNAVYGVSKVENNEYQYKFEVSAQPNPATESTTVLYQLADDSQVSIKVYSQEGTLVQTIADGLTQGQGFYQFNLSTKELNSGIYFVQVITNNGIATKAISVIK